MGMLDSVAEESPSGQGGDYLGVGNHEGVIEAVKLIKTPVNGEAIVVELRITKSSVDESVDTVKSIMYMDKYLAAKKAFVRLVMDITGCTEEELDKEALEAIVGEEQGMKGIAVAVQSYLIKTKSGNDFTKHNWSLLEGDTTGTEEDIPF